MALVYGFLNEKYPANIRIVRLRNGTVYVPLTPTLSLKERELFVFPRPQGEGGRRPR
jgi:hypothetical protein